MDEVEATSDFRKKLKELLAIILADEMKDLQQQCQAKIAEVRDKLTELEAKLDDREADLKEAVNKTRDLWRGKCEDLIAARHEISTKEERERILEIIHDWERCADPNNPDVEGGEDEFRRKYGKETTDLIDVIEQALKGEG